MIQRPGQKKKTIHGEQSTLTGHEFEKTVREAHWLVIMTPESREAAGAVDHDTHAFTK